MSPAMANRVFISSTQNDLVPYREAVAHLLDEKGFEVLWMETMPGRSEEPVEACIQDVVNANFFVGVYAWRYGHVPPGSPFSITERELRTAETLDRPIFAFLAHDSLQATWPSKYVDEGVAAHRLAEMKNGLKLRHTLKTFYSPSDLAEKVYAAIKDHLDRNASLTEERRLLMAIWKKVQGDWLEGVLLPSLPEGRRIEIMREERPQAVGRPLPVSPLAPPEPDLQVAEPIHDLFTHRSLLIMGESGAGKTIALLELARELGRLARTNSEAPIPVVFNLGSWRGWPSQLHKWMVGELRTHYREPGKRAKKWIRQNAILPLLDGLDEVAADFRDDCVGAINDYLDARGGEARLAVCCRTDVYEYEKLLLRLEKALVLKPLTEAQVHNYLAGGGPQLAGLREAIKESAELREIAASPFFLNLLERTYRDMQREEIGVPTKEEVLAAHVKKALEPQRPPRLPTRRPLHTNRLLPRRWRGKRRDREEPIRQRRRRMAAARRVLSWLARRMAEHDPSLFQIERLQPSWLASRAEIWAYALASRAIGGALIALPLAWFYSSFPLVWILFLGLLAGALAGGVDAVTLRHSRQRGSATRWGLGYPIVRGLLVFVGVAVLLLFVQFLGGEQLTGLGPTNRGFLIAAVLLAGWVGIGFGSRGARRDARHDVHVAESLKWGRWSWRGAGLGAFWGGFVGVVFSALALMSPTLRALGVWKWSQLIAYLVGLGGLLGGMVGRIGKRRLERNVWPNQGTWRGLGNTAVLTLGAGGVMALALALLIAVDLSQGQPVDWQDVSIAMGVSLAFGFWIGLLFGGLDFAQHFTLRAILRLKGRFPPGLVRFLDDAIDRRLLQQVGGSYKFYHPQLLRYFAESEDGSRDR